MFRSVLTLSAGLLWFGSAPAVAQDADDDLFSDPDTLDEDWLSGPTKGDDDVEDFETSADDEVEEETLLPPGVDGEGVYRAQLGEMAGLDHDEEVMAWERYLETYPASMFRTQIERRIDALMGQMRIDPFGPKAEDGPVGMAFHSMVGLEPIQPRSRVRAAVEYGLPTYLGAMVDVEYALDDTLSVHGGFQRRYGGWGVEAGARYAFFRSERHELIAAVFGDLRANVAPLYAEVRPGVGVAKAFGDLQVAASFAPIVETRRASSIALSGGFHADYRLGDVVGAYVETTLYARRLTRDGGPFAFHAVSFGLKFYPVRGRKKDPVEFDMGTNVPFSRDYLQYYFGSLRAQGTYYLD